MGSLFRNNVRGDVLPCRLSADNDREKEGQDINLSSVRGIRGTDAACHQWRDKSAVDMITQCSLLNGHRYNIM
jgi:hypothetical protein